MCISSWDEACICGCTCRALKTQVGAVLTGVTAISKCNEELSDVPSSAPPSTRYAVNLPGTEAKHK
jgi:hypothetical protein